MTKCLDSSPNRADDQSPEAVGLYSLVHVQETIVDSDPPAHYENGVDGVSENGLEDEPGFGEALTETKAAKSDKWTAHRADAQRLAKSLRRAKSKYGQEVSFCATELNLYKYEDTGSYGVRPFQTCKKRWCPICSWHASQKRWAAAQQRLPGLLEAQPPDAVAAADPHSKKRPSGRVEVDRSAHAEKLPTTDAAGRVDREGMDSRS